MKYSKLVLGLVVLLSAYPPAEGRPQSGCPSRGAVCWGERESASLAGFRLGEVIDVSNAAALKSRGLTVHGPSRFLPDMQYYYLGHAKQPSNGFISVDVYISTNREVVRVSVEAQCRPDETAEELKEVWQERYRRVIEPDGPYRLMLEPAPSSSPDKYPDILLIDIMTADYERNAKLKRPAQ